MLEGDQKTSLIPPSAKWMPSQKNILIIAPQPFFANRGTPMNVRAICECLGEAGYKVDLLVFPQGENLELSGVRIIRTVDLPWIKEVPVGISFSKLILDCFMFLTAIRLVWGKKYDLIHGVEEGAVLAVLLSVFRGSKSIFDMDSSIPEQLKDSGKVHWKILSVPAGLVERVAMKAANAVLTVCEALTKKAENIVPTEKITQIEDFPTDTSPPEPATVKKLKDQFELGERKLVVYTGNFHKAQGIEMLLDAVAVASAKEEFILLLVGGGSEGDPLFDKISAKVSELGLQERVKLAGNRPLEEMSSFLDLANVVVSPRIQGENTPLKVYSYMASGRPLVATDIYSHTQVLSQESAYLAVPEPEDFAKKIVLALREDSKAIVEKAESLVKEKYSRQSFNLRLLKLYEGLLEGNG